MSSLLDTSCTLGLIIIIFIYTCNVLFASQLLLHRRFISPTKIPKQLCADVVPQHDVRMCENVLTNRCSDGKRVVRPLLLQPDDDDDDVGDGAQMRAVDLMRIVPHSIVHRHHQLVSW